MTASILPKPKKSQWTDDQWEAIVEKGQDILVAAAAGSGKTAVLVERIIKRLTDAKEPIDVDRLLIVTFTNAAAAEMRGRIGQALEKALSADPNNPRLREQLVLLGKAHIMTFHAFCQSVIRKYYYKLDLDPAFRIAEQTEAELLREEVLESLFETYYGSPEEQDLFYALVDRYSDDRSDRDLFKFVLQLYEFSQSHPWPDLWLDELAEHYAVSESQTLDDVHWIPSLKASIKEKLDGLISALNVAEELAQEPGGPAPYLETLEQDRLLISRLLEASLGPWSQLATAFAEISFKTLKQARGADYDESLKKQVQAIRKEVKDGVQDLKETCFMQSPEDYLKDINEAAPYVSLLVRLVKEFRDQFRQVKRERGLLDFSDLEHDCLRLLRDEESLPGVEKPSEVAMLYRNQFDEVLIDEYQDTNQVQETVLWHVSHGGNRFMVGDVKQSIYRFRLAEPSLFLEKYKTFSSSTDDEGHAQGRRIDLSQNFRSRKEVLNGTNYIFSQIMDETVGEIEYDDRAALKFGSRDYDDTSHSVELHLIDQASSAGEEDEEGAETIESAQKMELEAHLIATQIENLIDQEFKVFDKSVGHARVLHYRDIVILIRSAKGTASVIQDVLKERGIPAYAELTTGYFEAVEVSIMMALLNVIDNPFQDIPLASVLRSPIVGLKGEELSAIRLEDPDASYYEALKKIMLNADHPLYSKLNDFYTHLQTWRNQARQGALADLIWSIYRTTGYYDYVAGLAGGEQRQANLKALYDRARQYEQTTFRGLFRFLRFIERLQERGSDLGEARALSEQEDVVRIMTIHKSKGLEFPVVFVAGMNKQFNKRDVYGKTLLHKSLGFGTKFVDPEARYTLPTLAHSAIKQQIERETIAEEMRVLYVALTRAREKLMLVGTVPDAEKALQKWRLSALERGWVLPAYYRSRGNRYLDWVGPAVLRHSTAKLFHDVSGYSPRLDSPVSTHPSSWSCFLHPANTVIRQTDKVIESREKEVRLSKWLPVDLDSSDWEEEVTRRLEWSYPNLAATMQMSKLTVTEIKRQQDQFSEGAGEQLIRQFRRPIGDRPAFLSKQESTAAELGTLTHRFMQLVTLRPGLTIEELEKERARMVRDELILEEEASRLLLEEVAAFFQSDVGERLVASNKIIREQPFSLKLPIEDIQPDWTGDVESIMVQGVIDCLFLDESGWNLLDYKTDRLAGRFQTEQETVEHLQTRYHVPMTLYRQAIERIWKQPVQEVGLWFFDGARYVRLENEC
ncbi:helicase-exonuclease AddAB subunit AddA [Pullulanibacillus sp. KACC 23026]|uniref:helicase-exonuclease AddAB subunit AddA n=1 Tax=Pullulanibacillus sp. KACC 23026 TaxID=3028315 RepID=UPI0023B020A0|nr:helicase-exonuclease AddAB subunit AddA [Pullulanibacillus sp. KACC 23026]WEG11960.1 helicase-exonuclease AddAB subunit AddA [Pullulanibacillus sp. KACC 23026]